VILWSFIFSNDIKDEREHEDQDSEEDKENGQVNNNVRHHSHDVTQLCINTHVKELLRQTGGHGEDHDYFWEEICRSRLILLDDTQVA